MPEVHRRQQPFCFCGQRQPGAGVERVQVAHLVVTTCPTGHFPVSPVSVPQCSPDGFKPHPRTAPCTVPPFSANHRPALWSHGSSGQSRHVVARPDRKGEAERSPAPRQVSIWIIGVKLRLCWFWEKICFRLGFYSDHTLNYRIIPGKQDCSSSICPGVGALLR